MSLYLGNSKKIKIYLNNVVYCLNLFSEISITNGDILLSSDNYILKDSSGVYLIPKGSLVVNDHQLLSKDGYILKDKNDLYLIIKGMSKYGK